MQAVRIRSITSLNVACSAVWVNGESSLDILCYVEGERSYAGNCYVLENISEIAFGFMRA